MIADTFPLFYKGRSSAHIPRHIDRECIFAGTEEKPHSPVLHGIYARKWLCAPLIADLFLFCYERDFMTSLSDVISVRVAERLELSNSVHGVAGSNPATGEILPEPKRRFIAQSLSCSPFHRVEMTEILLKGRKPPTHPSIFLMLSKLKLLKHLNQHWNIWTTF